MADTAGQSTQGSGQPMTVLVKKADGTFERKTLDQLKAAKSEPAASAPVVTPKVNSDAARLAMLADEDEPKPAQPTPQPVTQAVQPKPAPSPQLQSAQQTPATPKPITTQAPAQVVKPVVDPKKTITKDDVVSPLEEKLPQPNTTAPLTSPSRESQVEEIIKKAGVTVPATAANRLRTLIQLRLKDIRTAEQVEEAMVRHEEEGGVGLLPDQARTIMRYLPGGAPKKELDVKKLENELPAVTSPNNSFVHANTFRPAAPAAKPVTPPAQISKPAPVMNKQKVIDVFAKNNPEEPFFKIPTSKPTMHDITVKQVAIGPTDEIRVFTLIDFRRLSTNPEEAAMRFKQKFLNLKEESILLYMEGLEAWRRSPLYADYMATVLGSLAKKQALSTLTDKNSLTYNELLAIVSMEKQLDYV